MVEKQPSFKANVQQSPPTVLLVLGMAGSGKTTLVQVNENFPHFFINCIWQVICHLIWLQCKF